jgi:hypothetical protein
MNTSKDKLNTMMEDALLLLTFYDKTDDSPLDDETRSLMAPLFTMQTAGGGGLVLTFLLMQEYAAAADMTTEEVVEVLRGRLFGLLENLSKD